MVRECSLRKLDWKLLKKIISKKNQIWMDDNCFIYTTTTQCCIN